METNKDVLINQLSDAFSRIIVANYSKEQLAEVIAKNNSPEYGGGACATHDYFDSNMFMAEAFEQVMGREFIFNDDEHPETEEQNRQDTELWNAAWVISKACDFCNAYPDLGEFANSI